jgi:hypothetical protein
MGTTSSSPFSPCTNLLVSDDACDLLNCKPKEIIPLGQSSEETSSYLLQLKRNTKFQGNSVTSVIYSEFHNYPQERYLVHLCTFVKRAVEQNICPFFAPIYSIGYNCDPNVVSRDGANMVVMHGVPPPTSLETWFTLDLTLRDKQLMVFQLLYACYLLKTGHYFYGLGQHNLFVTTLSAPKKWTVVSAVNKFYEFTSEYQLQVAYLPIHLPLTNDLSSLQHVFQAAQVTFTDVDTTILHLATELQLFSRYIQEDSDVTGLVDRALERAGVEEYQNIQPFAFEYMSFIPTEPPPPEPMDPLTVQFEELRMKQDAIRSEIKKLLRNKK